MSLPLLTGRTAGIQSRCCDARRRLFAPQRELEVPKLEKNVLHPNPQLVIQCIGETSRCRPPKLGERKGLSVDQPSQREAKEWNFKRSRNPARVQGCVAIRNCCCRDLIVHRQE